MRVSGVRTRHAPGFLFRPQNLVSNQFAAMTQAKSSSRRRCQRLLQQPFARDFTAQDKAGASCDKGLRNLEENLKAIPELSSCWKTHPKDKCALPPVFPSAVVQEEPTGESILAFESARRVSV